MNSISSDLGDLSDVEPFTSFQEDPNSLGFEKDSFKIGSLNVNSLLCQQRISQVESIMKQNNFSVFLEGVQQATFEKATRKNDIRKEQPRRS